MKSLHLTACAVWFLAATLPAAWCQEGSEEKKDDEKRDGERTPRKRITVYFTPDGRLLPAISGEILKARKTLDIAMYSISIETVRVPKPVLPELAGKSAAEKKKLRAAFEEETERYEAYRERVASGHISVFDALAEAVERGVRVRMVFNEGHRGEWKTFQSEQLKGAGVDLRYTTWTMHEKFGIFDGKVLITGSANWSTSAALVYNESALFFHGHPELTDTFQEEFDRVWERAKPYPPADSEREKDGEDDKPSDD